MKILVSATVGSKLDGLIDWSWVSVLWPIWIALGIMVFISFVLLVMLIGFLFSWMCKQGLSDRFLVALWMFFAFAGASAAFILFFSSIAEDKIGQNCLFTAGFLFFFALITVFSLGRLKQRWLVASSFDHPSSSLTSLNQLPFPYPQSANSRIQQIVKLFKLPPITLLKLSNTYFQPTPQSETISSRTHTEEIQDQSKINVHVRSLSGLGQIRMLEEKRKTSDLSFLDKKCGICFENECNAVVMECGHGGVCYKCAEVLLSTNKICHLCRAEINQVLKIKIEPKKVLNVIGMITRSNSEY